MHLSILLTAEGGGFNPLDVGGAGNFLWTLVIFVLALLPMWKLVFGKIALGMAARDGRVAEAITAAERASVEAEKSRAAVEVALGEAQAEAAKLLAEARERAEVRERELLAEAKRESEALVASARATIRAEQEKALATIRNEVVELSLDAASRVIGRRVDGEDDRRLVAEIVSSTKAGRS